MEHSGKELAVNEKFFALPEEKQQRRFRKVTGLISMEKREMRFCS